MVVVQMSVTRGGGVGSMYIKVNQRTLASERTGKSANAAPVRDLLDAPHSRAQSGGVLEPGRGNRKLHACNQDRCWRGWRGDDVCAAAGRQEECVYTEGTAYQGTRTSAIQCCLLGGRLKEFERRTRVVRRNAR